MIVWLIIAAMTAAALAIILVPLLRNRGAVAGRAAYDLRVHRAQLQEVDRDLERGLLGEDEARGARLEIERRMLAAADVGDGAPGGGAESEGRWRAAAAIAVAAVLPLGAFLLYLSIGTPGAPDLPRAGRQAAQTAEPSAPAVEEMVARLAQRLEEDPHDVDGWTQLGRSYLALDRYADAAAAYEKALKLVDDRPDLASEYGESLVLKNGGEVVPAAREIFETTLRAIPGEPRARYYLALSAAQAGDLQGALDGWVALVKDAPAEAPWIGTVRERIDDVAAQLGVDAATVLPAPAPPSDTAAAAVDADPTQVIRDMVERLAARLAGNPQDLEGWLMLARSYRILGETEKAQGALQSARDNFADETSRQRIGEAAANLDLTPPTASAAAAPPAAPASNAGQAEAVRAMVDRLAARLAANPQDLDGWLMLARSYHTLGETEKAQGALQSASDAFSDAAGQRRIRDTAAAFGLAAPASPAPAGQ